MQIMNTTTSLDARIFISGLGQALAVIEPSMFSHADRPNFSLPEHSPIGGIFFKNSGFSLTFCSPDFYHDNPLLAAQSPIISNVQLYSGVPAYGHRRYQAALPFGLTFEDDQKRVGEKLGSPAWRHPFVPPFQIERFDLLDRWILVEYTETGSSVKLIQIGLKPRRSKLNVLPKIEEPNIKTIDSLLCQSSAVVARHPALASIELPSAFSSSGETCAYETDALATHGVELYFRQGASLDGQYALTGARYVRRGVNGSAGFDGVLPCSLSFKDRPESLAERVGSYPLAGNANVLTGYYVWRLSEYLLHVGFSVMEQRINRIYIAAHGHYSESLLASPLLQSP